MASKSVHVVPSGDGWAVRRSDAERDSSHHDTQEEAIAQGRETARREDAELVIHDREGKVRDPDSFGSDPFPPRDTRR